MIETWILCFVWGHGEVICPVTNFETEEKCLRHGASAMKNSDTDDGLVLVQGRVATAFYCAKGGKTDPLARNRL